jgi:hypothetical protein
MLSVCLTFRGSSSGQDSIFTVCFRVSSLPRAITTRYEQVEGGQGRRTGDQMQLCEIWGFHSCVSRRVVLVGRPVSRKRCQRTNSTQ